MSKPIINRLKIRWFALASLLLPLPLWAADSGKLVIVLDASNSMWGQVDSTHKVLLARSGLETLLAQQPADAAIGLVTYGNHHKSDCNDVSVVAKPGERDTPTLLQTINGIAPYGRSPISAALEQATRLLDGTGNILLVSDGPESCQANPCVTAAHLRTAHPDLRIHVLSFEDKQDSNSLRCVAEEGAGQFALIQDVNQLAAQLSQASTPTAAPDQRPAVADNTPGTLHLSAGASGSTARTEASQPVPPGDYRVNLLWRTTRLEQTLHVAAGQTVTQHFDLGTMGKLRLSRTGCTTAAGRGQFHPVFPGRRLFGGAFAESAGERHAAGRHLPHQGQRR